MRIAMSRTLCALALLPACWPAAAMAAANTAPAAAAPVMPASPLNLLLGIGFLLAMVIGAWWILRRAGHAPWGGRGNGMRVVASLPVGQRERVVLMELGGEQWLLGVAPGQVTLLHRFETPVLTGSSGDGDFAGRLRDVLQHTLGKS